MIVLRSIHQDHLVFNCLCGHVGKVALQDPMFKYVGDTTVNAVEKPHGAVVAGERTLLVLRSFMWAVVSLQCTVRTCPRIIKIIKSIPNGEATKAFYNLFLNLNNLFKKY